MGGGRSPSSIFNFPLNANNLSYGDNFVTTIIENSNHEDGPVYSCPSTKVILKDFEIYNSSIGVGTQNMQSADNNSILTGGFNGYGGFDTTINSATPGVGEVTDITTKLESGMINIIN
jgi:hypothetical protein